MLFPLNSGEVREGHRRGEEEEKETGRVILYVVCPSSNK